VLDVRALHLDVEADASLVELLDLGVHDPSQ
jgi:hypothetical protein